MTHSKSPKFWRSRFFSAFDQIGVDPDRSLIQGEAFTRHRKITLPLAARLIASLSSASVRQQTHTFCKNNRISFTESAFCQARHKFDHSILKDASLDFAGQVSAESSLHKGKYRLIDIDGSSFPILPNPEELQNLVEGHGKPHWTLHFNAAFDLENKYYLDYQVQSAVDKNENGAALDFVSQYDHEGIPVWIGDRLYFSYELASQIENRGQKFLFRMKERNCLSLLPSGHPLDQEIDFTSCRRLVNTQKAVTRNSPEQYKYVPRGSVSLMTADQPELEFPYRIIITEISSQNEEDGTPLRTMEYLLTNLSQEEFSTQEMRELYHLRWNIEISFRDLKYVLNGRQVHSRSQNLIDQEINTAVMVYNLISVISKCDLPSLPGGKYLYQTNRKALSSIVLQFLNGKAAQKEVIWTIQNVVLPIRKNRHFKRAKSSTASTSTWK
ncbi:IS4 family transposase [Ileibacterium valens]|uniref:IS4 family transposase n=1 Tax=Ileibacterium valens TaxID=1862668 RepID=UPI0024BB30DA|nr:IS4 family transposase [Ileibacterium valens]